MSTCENFDEVPPLPADDVTVVPIAAAKKGKAAKATKPADAGDNNADGGSAPERLMALAQELFELGMSDNEEPIAVVKGEHVCRYLRGSDKVRDALIAEYFRRYGKTAPSSAAENVVATLAALASQLDPEALHLRVARHGDGVVLDLGRRDGKVVIVTPAGWSVSDTSPVRFKRTNLTQALPLPERGAVVDDLRSHFNVDDESWPLLLTTMVSAFLPGWPHPVVRFTGPLGSAKSTNGRRVVALTDPSRAGLRKEPKNSDDFAVTAYGSWVVGLDNLSYIPVWLSDQLCRMATGEAFATRTLYSNTDITVIAMRRMLILTSIDEGGLAPDLASRSVTLRCPRLTDDYVEESVLDAQFEAARPALLGALLDTLAAVLAAWNDVEVPKLPRLADFGRLTAVVDHVLGTNALAELDVSQDRAHEDAVQADPVGRTLLLWVRGKGEWKGTVSELLEILPKPLPAPKTWPQDGVRLSKMINRIEPSLRLQGVEIEWRRSGKARTIAISYVGDATPAAAQPVEAAPVQEDWF